jgi:hypothetical protein
MGDCIHLKKPCCAYEFWALAANGICGRMQAENSLGLSELVHNVSEICVRQCSNKDQAGLMGETFHVQNDRLIEDPIKSVK